MLYKRSRQREWILEYMQEIQGHVSVEQICKGVNEKGNSISLATVYRNLIILEDLKQVKKLPLANDGFVYDKTCAPHYHFYCEECKILYDVSIPYKEELNDELLNEKHVHQVHAHEITFRGVCDKCQKQEEKSWT